MKHIFKTIAGLAIILATIFSGCSNDPKASKNQDSVSLESDRGEHNRDTKEYGGEEGEESGAQLSLDEVYDEVRKGVRLVLTYDAESNSFNGTVENTTDKILERIRVEVHLSSGIELGPTTPIDLKPGEKKAVRLAATKKDFDKWLTHSEVGSSEHGHSGEGDDEHDKGGGSEHK
ncbi:hypothetical protein ES705_11600 [subsurface metagenome]